MHVDYGKLYSYEVEGYELYFASQNKKNWYIIAVLHPQLIKDEYDQTMNSLFHKLGLEF